MIYEDFMNYGEGVYHQTSREDEKIGGHAMKMIGWGTDPVEGLYWVLQNQWSEEWGEKGFVKVKAGEIGIDSIALGCQPEI
jgi:cathepsin B